MGANQDIQSLAAEYVKNNLAVIEETSQAGEQPVEEIEQAVEEGQAEEATEEQPDLIELKANGDIHKLSLDEIKELASKGFDYTRKTQELSERSKADAERIADERTKGLQEERKRLIEAADMMEVYYAKPFVTPEQLDQLIQDGDTEGYLRLTRQEEKRKEILDAARSERKKIADTEAKAQQEQFNQAAIQHTEKLFEKMPELKDSENQKRLAQYLSKNGLSNDEIQKFIDHRGLIIAEKARRYDELSGGKIEPVRKDPPKVIKKVGAAVNKQTYVTKDLDESFTKLSQSGNLRDAASLLLKMRS